MLAAASLISIATLGCGSAETFSDSGATPSPPYGPMCASADPSQAGADSACGVFVSSTIGDDENPGTLERPVRTLASALSLAQQGPNRIYACAEVFREAAELPAGVELWGGLDCADGWRYVGAAKKTTIAPGAPGVIPLRFLPGDELARLIDVRLEAATGVEPGQPSIAALVLSGAAAEILRSELITGNGAPGAEGEQGGGAGAPPQAPGGADGLPGADACEASVNLGGAPVVTLCEGIETFGGKGGNGRVTYGDDGDDGQPIPANPDGVHGEGGRGENTGFTQCFSGQVGQAGRDGDHGLGAVGPGRITPDGWEGVNGQKGGDGLPGQGGGGGGGRRGPLFMECGTGKPQSGAAGGSGGSGGCGGKGGMGGGYGGASIGLLSLSADVTLRDSTITTGDGGDGGRGGLWQGGGLGGGPGLGGAGLGFPGGCGGGDGGKGGNGGFGGGGLGGSTIGVANLSGQSVMIEGLTINTGKAGKGGLGGSPYVTLPGTAGEDGLDVEIQGFPAP